MKKIIIAFLVLLALPTATMAQNTLTPEEQLQQAEQQLEEAKKAKEAAMARLKAKQEQEKALEMQRKIEEAKKETARLREETRRIEEGLKDSVVNETPQPAEPKTVTPAPTVAPTTPTEAPAVPAETTTTTPAVAPSASVNEEPKTIRTRNKTEKDDGNNVDKNAKYLKRDAVPVVDGQVQWQTVVSAPGKSADQIYDIAEKYLTQLTSDEFQLPGSQVITKDKSKHNLVASVHEWLVFKDNALSLDRTEIFYVLNVDCSAGQAKMTMMRVKYKYDVQGDVSRYNAEEWITDKEAVNKKHTRLYPISGKFRRKTIDRKDEIFETFKEALQQQ